MAGNTFGEVFRISTAGESHGPGNVAIVDGVPPGMPLAVDDFAEDLARRRPGQSKVTTQRKESDSVEILSGVFEGRTTGTSIALLIRNEDQRSRDYGNIAQLYRPGHADFSFDAKYGFRDYRGGGRSSARETNVRVAAGVIAKKLLASACSARIICYVSQIGAIKANIADPAAITMEMVEKLDNGEPNIVRCPDHAAAEKMITLINEVRRDQDSIGGVAEICVTGIPAGLGEPVFDKLKADLAKALFTLPAVLGVEYGVGFGAATMRGSEHNDIITGAQTDDPGRMETASNRHGGMLGGISTGQPIVLRAVVKPTSSLSRSQPTVDQDGQPAMIQTKGRHDPCLLPRFMPMAEAMVAITLADHWMRFQSQCRSVDFAESMNESAASN